MRLWLKIIRHTALPLDATAKRHARQIALEVVTPLVIGTDEGGSVASQLTAKLGAAVLTPIFKHVDAAVPGAADDHWNRPHKRAAEIAWLGDFRFKSDKIPGRSFEDALDLTLIDRLAGVDPIRNVRKPFRWPLIAFGVSAMG